MTFQKINDRAVNDAGRFEFSELENNELRKQAFGIGERLHPVSKFSDMVFVHRLSYMERGGTKINLNDSGVIAVVA